MIVPPGLSRPSRSAASIIGRPMRSLTEPPGLSISILARRSGWRSCGPRSRVTRRDPDERRVRRRDRGRIRRTASRPSIGARRTAERPGPEARAARPGRHCPGTSWVAGGGRHRVGAPSAERPAARGPSRSRVGAAVDRDRDGRVAARRRSSGSGADRSRRQAARARRTGIGDGTSRRTSRRPRSASWSPTRSTIGSIGPAGVAGHAEPEDRGRPVGVGGSPSGMHRRPARPGRAQPRLASPVASAARVRAPGRDQGIDRRRLARTSRASPGDDRSTGRRPRSSKITSRWPRRGRSRRRRTGRRQERRRRALGAGPGSRWTLPASLVLPRDLRRLLRRRDLDPCGTRRSGRDRIGRMPQSTAR